MIILQRKRERERERAQTSEQSSQMQQVISWSRNSSRRKTMMIFLGKCLRRVSFHLLNCVDEICQTSAFVGQSRNAPDLERHVRITVFASFDDAFWWLLCTFTSNVKSCHRSFFVACKYPRMSVCIIAALCFLSVCPPMMMMMSVAGDLHPYYSSFPLVKPRRRRKTKARKTMHIMMSLILSCSCRNLYKLKIEE